jgi:hypothetical protein
MHNLNSTVYLRMDSKQSQDKHAKYLNFYKCLKTTDAEYWGIGIENESYLMFESLEIIQRAFLNNQKRERYSVDYWLNYKPAPLTAALNKLPKTVKLPTYINSHFFNKCDLACEHITEYTKVSNPNPKFNGETINDYLRRVSPVFNRLFENNMIYDGDTFEFTTFDFYRANVQSVIKELTTIKNEFIIEMNAKLGPIYKRKIIYPQFNYGFAKFITNPKNVAICNNGTYHINITLPTKITSDGQIANLIEFKNVHANAIRAIQWIEPLLVALYGSPDILHHLDPKYSGGSQRLSLSRYIGLGTYDTKTMVSGKLLDTFDYTKTKSYFNTLHADSPYIPPKTTGYDFNYNKFKKHGIELRIFDYFPEKYLEDIMNFLILVCQFSLENIVPDPCDSTIWNDLCINVIKNGSKMPICPKAYALINATFNIKQKTAWFNDSVLNITNCIADKLYTKYSNSSLCKKMSPNMKPVKLFNYNALITKEQKRQI